MKEIDTKEIEDEKLVDQCFQELLDAYLQSKHRKKVEIISKAFHFAREAHKGVKRRSGEPYIMHPLAVAKVVCIEIGLGSTSICAALLHDVVEDTDYTTEDIENLFGPKIANIVDGLTKISGGIFGDQASGQAENFKKLLLTMSNDIRVILIKIADRLHNMRTLGSMLANKQYKIAGETLYIYAPLAHRLGLNKIKTELENLSFKYEHPDQYDLILKKLAETAAKRDELFENFIQPLKEGLDEMNFDYQFSQRIKSPYSIWHKIVAKNITFEDIYDILAVRIVFTPNNNDKELNECLQIYACISKQYKVHPDRLRDWVSHPKANGYQAIHVTVMSDSGQWIEVQIRSKRMDDVAEQGLAAHWKYKEGGGGEDEGELDKWLKTIREILDDPEPDAMDFLDTIKLNLYASEVFLFTPKGELKTLPQNSTALDFAFSISEEVGTHSIGAKVNHKLVPLNHKLKSGDQVEILTSKSQRVQSEWLKYITTSKAKSKINSVIKKLNGELLKQGKKELLTFLSKENIINTPEVIREICRFHNISSEDDLYISIGSKRIELNENYKNDIKDKLQTGGWRRYIPFISRNKEENAKQQKPAIQTIDTKKILKIKDDDIKTNYIIADCCNPIAGDEILGFVNKKNQVTIHKRHCPEANKLKASDGNKIVAAIWDIHKPLTFRVPISITGIDKKGLLNQITGAISEQLNVNIRKLEIEADNGIFNGKAELYVHNVNDVKQLCDTLRKIKSIKSVIRLEDSENTK
ncbi:MAG: RelA/SpoT family protein [Bacteroidaceae bacterium]